ncbi:MAG: hypothetical protein WC107_05625 [Patescibacteria group bacterium]|jgi:hypothetical protein
MSIIDTAIQRIQTIAKATVFDGTNTFKNAPDYPTDDASILPLVITHISGGNVTQVNATDTKLIVNIMSEIHFNRSILRITYQMIDTFIPDFIQRLGGDPTLASSASTIIYPVTFTVGPAEWDSIITQMVSFTIPVKLNLLSPTVTP